MSTVVLVVSLAAALLIGIAVGLFVARRRDAHRQREEQGPTVAELVNHVVQTAHNGVVVLGEFGDVLLHNPRARELKVVTDNRVDPRAREAAEKAAATGRPVPLDLTAPAVKGGRQPTAVLGEVRPLIDGFTVVDVSDESDSVRLEATRRDFVANVSHELKTPVGAMALLAEAILDCTDDEVEVRRFSEKILHESNRLGQLVTELIALSRLQGAERLPELHEVEVDEIIREALGRSALNAENRDITITTDEESGLTVEGDQTLLVTALANLVDNAINYSSAGSPVSVSRRHVGDFVEIAVTDRGIGIPVQHHQRVFERFYRIDKARSRATGGTGLGLAIVKHVAANHGGGVRLWSEPGTGSTFTLRIPAHQQAVTTDAPVITSSADSGGHREESTTQTVEHAVADHQGVT